MQPLKVLKVIHGFPPVYNAGSEVYSRMLVRRLAAAGHEVTVFTRTELQSSVIPAYKVTQQVQENAFNVYTVNNPHNTDSYYNERIDAAFADVLKKVRPDVVHVGHLNHLSTGIPKVASFMGVPVVHTLHDYWLICPRGQLLSFWGEESPSGENLTVPQYEVCADGASPERCASHCYRRSFGFQEQSSREFFEEWVKARQAHVYRDVLEPADALIAPSRFLREKFITPRALNGGGVDPNKIMFLPYGFDANAIRESYLSTVLAALSDLESPPTFAAQLRKRFECSDRAMITRDLRSVFRDFGLVDFEGNPVIPPGSTCSRSLCLRVREVIQPYTAGSPFVFGYLGTHTGPKGLDFLMEAAGRMTRARVLFDIWGRERSPISSALRRRYSTLFERGVVNFNGEYPNDEVGAVMATMDALVCPSIWYENSPLVLHEAQAVGLPCITADEGGMCELVSHRRNGLLFEFRNQASLTAAMAELASDPASALRMGAAPYCGSDFGGESGDIPSSDIHIKHVEDIYRRVIKRREGICPSNIVSGVPVASKQAWRITLDTNPDDCNFACTMCEGFSGLGKNQQSPRRVADVDQILRLLDNWIASATSGGPFEIIPSTMGEGALWAEDGKKGKGFIRLVQWIYLQRARGVPVFMNLTTNGTLGGITAEVSDELSAAVSEYCVSMSRRASGLAASDMESAILPARDPKRRDRRILDAITGRKSAFAWASLLLPIISDVKISWNAATAETDACIMGPAAADNWRLWKRGGALDKSVDRAFERRQEAVRGFCEARDSLAAICPPESWSDSILRLPKARVTFQSTFLMETNVPELPKMVHLAADLGVDRLKGHHLWAHVNEILPERLDRTNPTAVAKWNEIAAEVRALGSARGIIIEQYDDVSVLKTSSDASEASGPFLPDITSRCPFLGKEAWVDTEGNFNPCCAPAATRKEEFGEFPKVLSETNSDISQAWDSSEYLHLRTTWFNRSICNGCNMRRPV